MSEQEDWPWYCRCCGDPVGFPGWCSDCWIHIPCQKEGCQKCGKHCQDHFWDHKKNRPGYIRIIGDGVY